jgi:hypothetical protein
MAIRAAVVVLGAGLLLATRPAVAHYACSAEFDTDTPVTRTGAVVAAGSLKDAVITAVHLKINAEIQLQAMTTGTRGLSDGRVERSRATQFSPLAFDRAWEYFCSRAGVDAL